MYYARDAPLKEIEFSTFYWQKKNRADIVNDDIMCFDIETSSAFKHKDSNTLEPYTGKSKEYYRECEKYALCYIWQFSINDNIFYGRTLEDFKAFLDELEEYEPHQKFIYVHNLSYEFNFLVNILEFSKVFAREKRKPMYAEYENYCFRCSYLLTNMALATWAEQRKLSVKKLVGSLDYTVLRTPKTELTEKELQYCFNDVLVMYYGLKQYKEKYGSVVDIPLTQTGEVRQEVIKRMNVKEEFKYRKKCIGLIPQTLEEYKRLCKIFAGGFTHANAVHVNKVLHKIRSRDISSSYPTVMCLEKYPMTPFQKTLPLEKYFNNDKYSYIIQFEVYNLKSVRWNTWLSFSKCDKIKKYNLDNGRIIKCEYAVISMTNIDFEMFKKCYKFDELNILDFRVSINGYLSDTFVKYILELFGNKTQLKNIPEHEPLYMKSKQYINSLYGMCVTKTITDTIEYLNNQWVKELLTEETFLDKTNYERKKLSKTFSAFQFGVWVTAYARRNLWSAILELDYNVVYCDTDSVKYIECDTNFFKKYNAEIERKENERAKMLNVSRETFAPKDKKGIVHRLGVFDDEGIYDSFKTLGAKKYCFVKDGKLGITVSGVRKGAVSQLKSIDDFKDGLVFDVEHTKKTLMSYEDDMQPIVWNKGQYDEFYSTYKHGICALPTTYSLGMTEEFNEFVTMLQNARIETELFKNETEILFD